ncbi:hypothetical protein VF21_02707 [Pseudogymnoascus sp. 05NY08]|nr:hypothetical protein VF21_02707 [Pseudogymnoascus sp. 05NY08]
MSDPAAAAVAPPSRQSPALDPQLPPPNQGTTTDLEARDTISELRRSLKALVESEMGSQRNHKARLQYEMTNSYARVYVSQDEMHLRSLETQNLKQAMEHRISTSVLTADAVPVSQDSAQSNPFFDLEPVDLLKLTPYYLPCYLGGVDPHPEGWRESLGVFPPGYPGQYIKNTIQNYKMQLDALEMHNKATLMRARQEQDDAPRASDAWLVALEEQHKEDFVD